jgi:uncharacterized protein (TIGR01244 family)
MDAFRLPARSFRCLLVLLCALGATATVAQGAQPTAAPAPAAPSIAAAPAAAPADQLLNARDPLPGVRTGGTPPTAEVFAKLASEGYLTYVDLRPEPELAATARAAAEAAGLAYVQIPVGSDVDLDLGTVRALDAILDDAARTPAVVACASGNRSGALLALRAFWLDRKPAEEALALGRAAGLTRLEPSVRQLLGLPPAAVEPPPN